MKNPLENDNTIITLLNFLARTQIKKTKTQGLGLISQIIMNVFVFQRCVDCRFADLVYSL